MIGGVVSQSAPVLIALLSTDVRSDDKGEEVKVS